MPFDMRSVPGSEVIEGSGRTGQGGSLKPAPSSIVIRLQQRIRHGKCGRLKHVAALEHEGERIVDLVRRQFGAGGFVKSGFVCSVRGKGVVQ